MEPFHNLLNGIKKNLEDIFIGVFDTTQTESRIKSKEIVNKISIISGNIFFIIFFISSIYILSYKLILCIDPKILSPLLDGFFKPVNWRLSLLILLFLILSFVFALKILLNIYKIIDGLELTKLLIIFSIFVFVINFIRKPIDEKDQYLKEQVIRFLKLEPLQDTIDLNKNSNSSKCKPLKR